MYRRHVLKDERLKGIAGRCPQCGGEVKTFGEMYRDEGLLDEWFLGFYCPRDKETIPMGFGPEVKPLIDEVSKGVDWMALPLWHEAHEEPAR